MKFLRILQLCSTFAFCYQPLFAADTHAAQNLAAHCQNNADNCSAYSPSCCPCYSPSAHFGTAGLMVTDTSLWYTINTNAYPDTVPLSQNRNKGAAEGNIFLSPTGFTIGEEGNYWISITAVLQNTNENAALIPVFLVLDETFNPDDPSLIGGAVSLEPNEIDTVHATGIIKNIAPGTRISLVATNGGDPFPQPVNVASWSISLFKIP